MPAEGQAPAENHSQTARHLFPRAMEVEGEPLSPDDTVGWLDSYKKVRRRELEKLNQPLESKPAGRQPRAAAKGPNKAKNKTPLPPRLPREDLKIVVRPRNGLDISEMSEAQLRDCIIRATGLEPTQAADDILRTNPKQNTFVISTPSVTRAEAYVKIRELSVHGSTYEAMAYAAPPDNTSRGVIRNIPDYDTPDDITKSLVYRKNPTILQARRMGKSSSVIILFEGSKVPYYVYYRGAEMRCYLHKKTHEICEACGKVGHRTDVCPKPESTYCKVCGMQQPSENHKCEPKCALCGKGHPTGDKKCHQRFHTPYLLRQRQWQKKL